MFRRKKKKMKAAYSASTKLSQMSKSTTGAMIASINMAGPTGEANNKGSSAADRRLGTADTGM